MTFPSHCFDCGAVLVGGATVHKPECELKKMMDRVLEGAVDISQPKTLLRIDEVFVFIAKDVDGEGVPAFMTPDGMMLPMVCADKARVDSLREMAKRMVRETRNKITLCRFSLREEIEVIEP
jgi:hypothetical protein